MKIKKVKSKESSAIVQGTAKDENGKETTTEDHHPVGGIGDSAVGVKLGITVPGPQQFSSVRVDVSIEVPTFGGDIPETYEKLVKWAQERLQETAEELYEGLD